MDLKSFEKLGLEYHERIHLKDGLIVLYTDYECVDENEIEWHINAWVPGTHSPPEFAKIYIKTLELRNGDLYGEAYEFD